VIAQPLTTTTSAASTSPIAQPAARNAAAIPSDSDRFTRQPKPTIAARMRGTLEHLHTAVMRCCYDRSVVGSHALRNIAVTLVAAGGCGGSDGATPPWMPTDPTQAEGGDDDGSAADDEVDGSTADDGPDDGSDEATTPSTSSATATEDTASDETGAVDCTLPDPAPAWLEDDARDIVARLSGETELAPGITLADRSTPSRRAQTAEWLQARFDEIGLVGERHDYAGGTNVFALVAATMASEGTLVFGAHYDTVPGSPGANDNATGVAVALALARQLQGVPCRRYDLIVVLFDQEEIGLVGSAAFAQALIDENEPVVAVHTIDQQGWDADGDRRIEIERPDAGLLEFYDDAADELPAPMELVPTDTGFTDHVSFRAAGFPAVGITEEFVSGDTTPHYHQPGDTYDTVDFDYLVSGTTLVNHAFARALSGR
jgi:hypothetical protein